MEPDENAPELWDETLVDAVKAAARAVGCTCECRLAVFEHDPGIRQMALLHEPACRMVIKDRRAQAADTN